MQTIGKPELSVIFVNHRSVHALERAVSSLLESVATGGTVEMIVANNDRGEDIQVQDLAQRFGFRLVSISENRGFANAANVAASVASGDVLAFLNPDTEFVSGSLHSVTRFFEAHGEVGIVGARLLDENDRPEEWSVGQPLSLVRLLRNQTPFSLGRRYWENRRAVAVGWTSGGAMFIRRTLFDQLSGFDEDFFLYFEDMDICVRAGKAGFRTVYFPQISFRHSGGTSFRSDAEKKKAYYESQDRYFMKHRPFLEGSLLRIIRSHALGV